MRPWPARSIRCTSPRTCLSTLPTRSEQFPKPPTLPDSSVETFREAAFDPKIPAFLPPKTFAGIPACKRWFKHRHPSHPVALNHRYFEQHGSDTFVPLEYTKRGEDGSDEFQRLTAPLSVFLAATRLANKRKQERIYLAQCQLTDLPQALRDDVPTPEIVSRAGKGDIYDTNIWIGLAPTNTPLHKDPNPNLFVQLAGSKVVRILTPELGAAIYEHVQEELGRGGSASFRGEGMMYGKEKALLDGAVWTEHPILEERYGEVCEAELEAGDAIFIPRGWWHSIKGMGHGVTASANWWFR